MPANSLLAQKRQQRPAVFRSQPQQKNASNAPIRIKQFRAENKHSSGSKAVLIGLLCLVVLAGIVFVLLRVAVITQIKCEVAPRHEPCDDALTAELHTLAGKSLYFTNINAVTNHVSATHPKYEHFTIKKHPPNNITIEVTMSPLVYIIATEQAHVYVNTVGDIIIESAQQEQLPTVFVRDAVFTELSAQTALEISLHQQLSTVLTELSQSAIEKAKVEWRDEHEIALFLPDQRNVLLSFSGLKEQLEVAKKIIPLSMEDTTWQELDLRFDKPILR